MPVMMYPIESQLNQEELRYSLRSVEKYANPDEVIIVGELIPDWLTNVTWLKVPDQRGQKQMNIKRKIAAALGVASEIVMMNDDVYLLKPYEPRYVYSSDLKHIGESGAKPLYEALTAMGKPTKNFDTHSPIVYDRRFLEVMEQFPAGCIIKSAFCNYLGIDGINQPDSKINSRRTPDWVRSYITNRPDCSTGPQGVKSVLPVMEEMFPLASKYEIV